MFGLSLSEIVVIALVALIVIGPERLPKTARALGLLMGRAQRYVNDIKSDIEREMHVDDIKKFKDEVASSVTKVKSSVEGEITSITDPIKNLSNPLETVKSEVQDLEKQLKGTLNPLPDLEELKLDEVAKKAASVPLTEAPKTIATKTTATQSSAAVAAGVTTVEETAEGATTEVASPELVQIETKTPIPSQQDTLSSQLKAPAVAMSAPEFSVVPSAAFEPTRLVEPELTITKKLPTSTVAEAIIYPEEDDASLASGVDVVKQRWSPAEIAEVDSESVSESVSQVAGIYEQPGFEPLLEPEYDAGVQEERSEAWDAFVELNDENPVDSDRSLEGLELWEQMPEDKASLKAREQVLASTEAEDKNNSSSINGGSNV
ncbi:MAG: Sec-independent protein translocase protein TatB [Alcaligenaceae bacterium]|nr:Sec-independent protein translocase protein TatB [Alcaligenaceae bacterium]